MKAEISPTLKAENFPRLLFITNEPPHLAAAGSIVFHRLFEGYPADRLRIITNSTLPQSAQRLSCTYLTHNLWADRLQRTRFWNWRTAARVLGGASFLPLGPLDSLVGNFKPDAVVTSLQDSWYYELAARYARKKGLPLVLFVHDLPHGFEVVAPWLEARQLQRDRAVYAQAALRFYVSPGMEAWFKREFGLAGEVLLHPRSLNPPSQDPEQCQTLKHPGRLTLGYAGGLYYGYGEQLAAMIPVLRATQTQVEVFGTLPSKGLAVLKEAGDVLKLNGYVSPPEKAWSQILAKCDATLLPYLNPPGRHHLQYQTHFPSKLADMLSLGLPLLLTGPKDGSGLVWCRDAGDVALAVSDPAPEALAAALNSLRDDGDLRVRLAKRALESRLSDFEPAALRSQLFGALNALLKV